MSQPTNPFKSDIPSNKTALLRELVGRRIVRLVRYSWLAPSEAVSQYGFDKSHCFSLTAGPLSIEVDSGLIVAFASDPALASIICWAERDSHGAWKSERLDQDLDLFPVLAEDAVYSTPMLKGLAGTVVSAITVVMRSPVDHEWNALPREAALRVELASGVAIWLAHGLHDDSDDFSVLDKTQLLPRLLSELKDLSTIN